MGITFDVCNFTLFICIHVKVDVLQLVKTQRIIFISFIHYYDISALTRMKMSKTNLQKLHGGRAGIRSTISMFIETDEESKEQLNIKRFRLPLEELEMERKTLYEVHEKIMSVTDVEHIEEEIINTRKESFKLKLTLMGLRDLHREVDTEETNVNRNSQTKQCADGRFEEQIGRDGAAESQNNLPT